MLSLLRRLSTRHYPRLLMSSGACSTAPAARQQLSIDISPARRSAANPQAAIAAVDRWDKQTDIQTDKQTNGRLPTVTFLLYYPAICRNVSLRCRFVCCRSVFIFDLHAIVFTYVTHPKYEPNYGSETV